jgi:hypothetical protein
LEAGASAHGCWVWRNGVVSVDGILLTIVQI